jgi:ParB-like chromosome segregation protein Spo0J
MIGDLPTYARLPAERPIQDVTRRGRLQAVNDCDLSEYPTKLVPVTDLVLSNWLRVKGEDIKHVRALAEVEDELPPIVVHQATMRVIDGMHRVRAAMLSGVAYIEALLFDGAEDEAFLLAVRLNVAHGLPLSRADRTAAAVRIIHSSPQWSDRAIARAAGLSDKTVASLRRRARASAEIPHLPDRIGRDGRIRPFSPAAGRRVAGDLIAQNPDAAIREIALRAGISPGTARDVRERLRNGLDPVPPRQRDASGSQPAESRAPGSQATGFQATGFQATGFQAAGFQAAGFQAAGFQPGGPPAGGLPPGASQAGGPPAGDEDDSARERYLSARMTPKILESLRNDPSLRYNETGRVLLRLLALHTMSPADWEQLISAVPLHRAQAVAQVARSSAEAWREFATRLEYVAQHSVTGALAKPRSPGHPGDLRRAGDHGAGGGVRAATSAQNSPTVSSASSSASFSSNVTANLSSTRMASSASASDSRSAPRGPSSVSSSIPSTS